MKKRALLTGITGMDGSHLADFLLGKDYEVYGILRRTSTKNLERIAHILDKVCLIPGDVTDQASMDFALKSVQPDECYHLSAQSYVGISWGQPELTMRTNTTGTLRVLEAIRKCSPQTKLYFAGSSEQWGKVQEIPQKETTPFYPRSPYGISKVAAYWLCVNYRESYKLFISCGLCCNHECLAGSTPLIIRRPDGLIDIVATEDFVSVIKAGRSNQSFDDFDNTDVWDGQRWTRIQAITATRRRSEDSNHQMLIVRATGGLVEVTAHHHMLDEKFQPIAAFDLAIGHKLAIGEMPISPHWTAVTSEMAELLGLLTADGYIERNGTTIVFTKNNEELRTQVSELWSRVFAGENRWTKGQSGFRPENEVGQVILYASSGLAAWLREQLYTKAGDKKVPSIILNAPVFIQKKYLDGYYAGDGLKTQRWDSFLTNSETLAQGLLYLYNGQGRECSVSIQTTKEWIYYRLNLGVPEEEKKLAIPRRDPSEVRNLIASKAKNEWVYDIETASGQVCAGIGKIIVHNSPRRGIEFVTRKISDGVARIKLGMANELRLGNLEARRDWSYAGDFVRGMWMMLQHEEPEDFVLASGVAHSVRDFVSAAFSCVDLFYGDYVKTEETLLRPAEVDLLVGDASKARRVLGWRPEVSFHELIQRMVAADMHRLQRDDSPSA